MKLHIEKAIYGGAGLARAQGKAIFVPFTLPEETIEAELAEDNHGYATAELSEVVEASPHRTAPSCPYFGVCGGCHYQHSDYPGQLAMKAAILRESLERARIGDIPAIGVLAGEPLGYRNRIRLHVQSGPFALCYKRRKSNVNLPVATCPITAPVLQEATEVLNREGSSLGIADWANEVEIFTNHDETQMLLCFWEKAGVREAARALTRIWPQLQTLLPAAAGAGLFTSEKGRRASSLAAHVGEESLRYVVGEHAYAVSLGSFFQVNRFLISPLVQLVTGGESGAVAWDLYAGAGLFSLPLTQGFAEVAAVEPAASARDLRANLRGTRHRVVVTETAAFLRQAVARRQPAPDLLVVDPPRSGLGAEVTTLAAKIRPRNITYVSCDPATLSRDLKALLESGYRLRKMHLADLFPQTFHLESVTQLSLG